MTHVRWSTRNPSVALVLFALGSLVLLPLLAACGSGVSAPSGYEAGDGCVQSCGPRQCGDDGCGGSCGQCSASETCGEDGICRGDCDATCETAGYECGVLCGEVCGACAADGEACVEGRCVCAPDCDGKACDADDGCGGACGPCASDLSCASCALKLSIAERLVTGGSTEEVTLVLDYVPAADTEMPGMADIRLRVDGPATLLEAGIGGALIDADKALHVDSRTGRPYRVLADGALQFLVVSNGGAGRVGSGRWLVLRFAVDDEAQRPAVFSLVPREGIFAPPKADTALWGTDLDDPVVVWAREVK